MKKNKEPSKSLVIVTVVAMIIFLILLAFLIYILYATTLKNKTPTVNEIQPTPQVTIEPTIEPTAEPTVEPTEKLVEEIKKEMYTLSNKKDILTKQEIFSNNSMAVVYVNSSGGSGSGVVISENGYVITNKHVVDDDKYCEVSFLDSNSLELKNTVKAKVIFFDSNKDLALLKLESDETYNYINICLSENVKIGDDVCAIGNPRGLINTLTYGLVSSIRTNNGREEIQTDASTNYGSSGGALFNMSGELIGITTSSYIGEGFSFAVTSREVVNFLDSVKISNSVTETQFSPFSPVVLDGNLVLLFFAGEWANGYDTYDYINQHEIYKFYLNGDFKGVYSGTRNKYEVEFPSLEFDVGKDDYYIALSSDYNAVFRDKVKLANDNPTYLKALDDLFDPTHAVKMHIKEVYQFDLENDGVNEVFVSAQSTWHKGYEHDYTIENIIFMRKLVDGKVKNFLFRYDFDEGYEYTLLDFCDINSDGTAEMIVKLSSYLNKYSFVSIYEFKDNSFKLHYEWTPDK